MTVPYVCISENPPRTGILGLAHMLRHVLHTVYLVGLVLEYGMVVGDPVLRVARSHRSVFAVNCKRGPGEFCALMVKIIPLSAIQEIPLFTFMYE